MVERPLIHSALGSHMVALTPKSASLVAWGARTAADKCSVSAAEKEGMADYPYGGQC